MVEIECDTLDQVAEAAAAGADAVLLDNMDPGQAVGECVALAHRDARGPMLIEVSGGVTLEHRRRLRRGRARPHLGRRPDPLGARARPRPRSLWRDRTSHDAREEGLSVLLAIDVGNTETVIGLYTLRRHRRPCPSSKTSVGVGIGTERDPTAPAGLTHHWRLSTVPSRTPDEHAVLLTQLLDLEGLDIASSVSGIAVSSSVPHVTAELRQMATRWFTDVPCVVLGPGHQERDADPLRQPQGGRRRPHRQRRRRLRPLRRAVRRGRHGHRDHGRGHQRQGRVPGRAPSPRASPSASTPSTSRPPRCAGSSSSSPAASSAVRRWSRSSRAPSTGSPAQVDGLARRFMDELGPSTVVATGGFSSLIAPHSDTIEHVEPWLTLHGLRIVYERNVNS